LWSAYFAARKIKDVSLDGYTFNLEKMSDIRMKLALLSGEDENFDRQAVLQYARPEYPVFEFVDWGMAKVAFAS
jgi:hypothetical protein